MAVSPPRVRRSVRVTRTDRGDAPATHRCGAAAVTRRPLARRARRRGTGLRRRPARRWLQRGRGAGVDGRAGLPGRAGHGGGVRRRGRRGWVRRGATGSYRRTGERGSLWLLRRWVRPARGNAGRERAAAPSILPMGIGATAPAARRGAVSRVGVLVTPPAAVCAVCATHPPFGPGSPRPGPSARLAVSSWRGFGAWCPPGVGGGRSHSGGASMVVSSFFKLGITYSGLGLGQQKGRPLGRPREAWSHAVRIYRGCLTARARAIVRGQT